MEEQNQTNFNEAPKKKGSKKPLVICLCIILILAIVAAVVIFFLVKSGKLNFSKKAKMQAGVEQLTETITKPFDDLTQAVESGDLTVKVFDNLSKDSAITVDTEMSAKLDTLEVDSLSSQEKEIVDGIKDLLKDTKISSKFVYDGKENVYVSGAATVSGNDLSAEAMYKDEEGYLRVKEVSEKWMSAPKKELLEMLDIEEDELTEFKEKAGEILDKVEEAAKESKIDDKTAKEIEERYKKVLKDFVAKKDKDIKSEKTKVKVAGKERSASKLTLTLDEKDMKNLLKEYVKTFKNDEQLQGIVKDSLNQYTNTLKDLSTTMGVEDEVDVEEIQEVATEWDSLMSQLGELEGAIDELSIPFKVKLVVYATNTDVLRTDIGIVTDAAEIKIETTFESDEKSETKISAKAQGQSIDIATVEIEGSERNGRIKISASEFLAAQSGMDALSGEISYKIEGDTQEATFVVDAGKYGKGTLTTTSKVTANTDSEYRGETTITADINSDKAGVVVKGSVNYVVGIKAGDASMPTVAESEKVSASDEAAMKKFGQEIVAELKKSDNKVRKFVKSESINNFVKLFDGTSAEELLDEAIKEMESSLNGTPAPVIYDDNVLTPPTLEP